MNANEFEEKLNIAVWYLDNKYTPARAIRDLGYNLHFYNETLGYDNTDDQTIKWRGLVGLEGILSSYITVFDGTVNPNITNNYLFRIYEPALRALHRFAVNKRYGLNCCMPADVFNTITDTSRLTCLPYNEVLNSNSCIGLPAGGIHSNGGTRWYAELEPKKIHFNGPATVVEWNDGTKTVVKCQRGDTFDPLTGVAMCCMKKMLGTNESGSNYLNDVSKLIDEALEAKNKRYERKRRRNDE